MDADVSMPLSADNNLQIVLTPSMIGLDALIPSLTVKFKRLGKKRRKDTGSV
jgi:hypothetical protein